MEDIGVLFKHIHDRIEKKANKDLKEVNLTFSQNQMIVLIGKTFDQTMSLKELEEKMGLAQSTIVGIADRLVSKGFLLRSIDPLDKRKKFVRLSNLGKTQYENSVISQKEMEQLIQKGLSKQEIDILKKLLEKVYKNVNEAS